MCNRQGIHNLEHLSVTDLECSWKGNKRNKTMYDEPTRLEDYCHVEQLPVLFLVRADKRTRIMSEIQELCPDSVLNVHRTRRRAKQVVGGASLTKQSSGWSAILSNAEAGTVMGALAEKQLSFTPSADTMQFYKDNIVITKDEAEKILRDTYKDKLIWMTQRRNRITGTTCYPLFTYSKKDWHQKVLSTLHSSFKGNSSTRYGNDNEEAARLRYEEVMQRKVITCGLVVSTKNPWLACSPDGVVMEAGSPCKLVEIKCPVKGKQVCATEVVASCNFLASDGENYKLKKRHTYYAQVQLGMAILNVCQCDFVVYAAFDNSVHVINVKFDYEFLWKMVSRLHNIYFEHVLSALCAQPVN
ncbi:uncharacterized protein LOC135373798 [Ornithodoros turicata]|uniref:uncharacterized protein LOC135373798 n=1 Tax=Ornithodoros turicata TaxID=34597 RepID=UPI0031386A3E